MKEKWPIASKNLPNRIKQLRLEKKWSQGQLAKKLETDAQRVSKYERGVIFPTVDMMIRLADAFGISLDYLIKDDGILDVSKIPDQELALKFNQVSKLSEEERKALIVIMDAMIKKYRFESVAST